MSSIKYYTSFDQDFATTRQQDLRLPKNYRWLHHNFIYKFFAALLYPLVVLLDLIYMKFFGHITIKNRRLLRQARRHGGYYLYSNHTLLFGDVVNPFVLTFPTHPYLICSPSNLGIPVLGPLLPMAGALPIPNQLHAMKDFTAAITTRIKQHKAIIIYPESHLWPYCTQIRPFADAAFHYPLKYPAPVYVATTTFQKSCFHKKPRITIYLDGPFLPDRKLPRKQAQTRLHNQVHQTMQSRAKNSTYDFISYRPQPKPQPKSQSR